MGIDDLRLRLEALEAQRARDAENVLRLQHQIDLLQTQIDGLVELIELLERATGVSREPRPEAE